MSARTSQALLDATSRIGREVARPAADDVDRTGRFPRETIDALREVHACSAYVPTEFGGLGCNVAELAAMCSDLGRHCAASAMVMAMHHIQVACLVHHASKEPYFCDYLRRLGEQRHLIASVTSEVGIGGDMRRSHAAVTPDEHGFTLEKEATTISYGAYADDLLVTARRHPDAAPGDQTLVLLCKGHYTLDPTSVWDTLGMRGTCSPGFRLSGRGGMDQLVPAPFSEVASSSMVPFAHLLWSATWLGIATDAVSRARAYIQMQARKQAGTLPPGAQRLARAASRLQTMRSVVHDAVSAFDAELASPNPAVGLGHVGFALRINHVKVVASELVTEIVAEALAVCGIHGYRNDSPYSVGRHLRDAYSAAVMIGNDRITANNASLLLVHKAD